MGYFEEEINDAIKMQQLVMITTIQFVSFVSMGLRQLVIWWMAGTGAVELIVRNIDVAESRPKRFWQ